MDLDETIKPLFRDYLHKVLKKFENVKDPGPVAEYIEALVTKFKNFNEMKESLLTELDYLFKEDTTKIVGNIMNLLEDVNNIPYFKERLKKEIRILDGEEDIVRNRSRSRSRSPYRNPNPPDKNYERPYGEDEYNRYPRNRRENYRGDRRDKFNNNFNRRRQVNRPFKRKRCFDYFGSGICQRGDNCPYEHGDNKITLSSEDINRFTMPFNGMLNQPNYQVNNTQNYIGDSGHINNTEQSNVEAYDPEILSRRKRRKKK